jgi:hypothetical protein
VKYPLHKSNQARNSKSTVVIEIKIISTAINVCEVLVEKYHGNEDASQNTRIVCGTMLEKVTNR